MSEPITEAKKQHIRSISGGVTAPMGFQAAGVHCGVKRQKKDLSLLYSDRPCAAAGTFTTNRVKAAPLFVTENHLKAEVGVRAVVINSGNANACTGQRGLEDARRMTEKSAEVLRVDVQSVLVASTGVIGEPLAMDKIESGIEKAAALLSPDGGADAALGILTTDTRPKEIAVKVETEGLSFTIGGMAKGSGMIHPNMATMLAFVTTDVAVEQDHLRQMLVRSVDRSFNMITVDGDTSTNDMVLALANGAASKVEIEPESPEAGLFEEALTHVCTELAKMIAADGEGATRMVEVRVTGAASESDARKVVRSISSSALVKTAIYGEDANWGRIMCAAGYSGADFDPDRTHVYLGDVKVFENGLGLPFDEEKAADALRRKEVVISVDLGAGDAHATGWTCDLTYDYVKINASYRT